jgi:hypothetical protein
MNSLVFEISADRMYRDLFWGLARIGPLVALAFLVLLLIPSWRRWGVLGLIASAAGAAVFTAVFHNIYALGIWENHDSAIRYLDESAFLAGFSASALAYVMVRLSTAAAARLVRRA